MLPSLLYKDETKRTHTRLYDDDAFADLNLAAVCGAMADRDADLRKGIEQMLREHPACTPEDVCFRQGLIQDALRQPALFQALFETVREGVARCQEQMTQSAPGYARFETAFSKLRAAVELLGIQLEGIAAWKALLRQGEPEYRSEAMLRYAQAFHAFFSAEFLEDAKRKWGVLSDIAQGSRVALSVRFGQGMKGTGFIVRRLLPPATPMRREKRAAKDAVVLDSGSMMAKGLELQSAALSQMLRVVQRVTEKTLACMRMFCSVMGFCVGGIRLAKALDALAMTRCFPQALPAASRAIRYENLVDVGLALSRGMLPVGNAWTGEAALVLVTGANQGGKSTFLRSFGLAQIMMQAGLFVAAAAFCAGIAPTLHTHFCRPEDERMRSGKLDEELRRMQRVVRRLHPNALLLMNESFSSTAEHEGASIAQEIVPALSRSGVRVFFVTHLYDFAQSLCKAQVPGTVFLRAARDAQGKRPFLVLEGPPLPTSHGMDLYDEIIGALRETPLC
ncbi:MAG TPA: hypothetical protein PKE04_11080 [Clostridia bacterium]|nr:hypothetical protein [Clostridia bacterium]